mmetsp:Transcript_2196/g.5574  ORF Transcript_2196/g.5574 Transcript_2196/m.5574 type:complete len:200 (+) Transcript_2196:2692-3291(+)
MHNGGVPDVRHAIGALTAAGGAARAASGAGPHVPLRVTAHGRGAAGRVAEGAGEHAAAPQVFCQPGPPLSWLQLHLPAVPRILLLFPGARACSQITSKRPPGQATFRAGPCLPAVGSRSLVLCIPLQQRPAVCEPHLSSGELQGGLPPLTQALQAQLYSLQPGAGNATGGAPGVRPASTVVPPDGQPAPHAVVQQPQGA